MSSYLLVKYLVILEMPHQAQDAERSQPPAVAMSNCPVWSQGDGKQPNFRHRSRSLPQLYLWAKISFAVGNGTYVVTRTRAALGLPTICVPDRVSLPRLFQSYGTRPNLSFVRTTCHLIHGSERPISSIELNESL
jgi:hypothetical protein